MPLYQRILLSRLEGHRKDDLHVVEDLREEQSSIRVARLVAARLIGFRLVD